jgi:exodeoxyribonuclease-3
MEMILLSWNVNGLRAVAKKGFPDVIRTISPEIVCIQETRVSGGDALPAGIREIPGYHAWFSAGERAGYSGVALYSKREPEKVSFGFEGSGDDPEGRIIIACYPDFVLYNIYFPNGKRSAERLAYKYEFYDRCLEALDAERAAGNRVVLCGDVNTAHREIDLARPRENAKISGFLPRERAWIDRLISHGFVDAFRLFNDGGSHYTWWDLRTRARERNVGWRIDYFFVDEALKDRVTSCEILADIMGSDHCPVMLELALAV